MRNESPGCIAGACARPGTRFAPIRAAVVSPRADRSVNDTRWSPRSNRWCFVYAFAGVNVRGGVALHGGGYPFLLAFPPRPPLAAQRRIFFRRATMSEQSAGDAQRPGVVKPVFDPKTLDRTVIALPLLQEFKDRGEDAVFDVVIDLNLNFPGGREH